MSWSGSIGGVLRSALWRRRDFVTFWAGQTISMFGSRVTVLALPLTAILTLRASPFQMGLLEAMGAGASLVFSLPAGVWADRVRRRPMMVAANLGQGTGEGGTQQATDRRRRIEQSDCLRTTAEMRRPQRGEQRSRHPEHHPVEVDQKGPGEDRVPADEAQTLDHRTEPGRRAARRCSCSTSGT